MSTISSTILETSPSDPSSDSSYESPETDNDDHPTPTSDANGVPFPYKVSEVMNWKYNYKTKTLKSWQSVEYAVTGRKKTSEGGISHGFGVDKTTGKRNVRGSYVCTEYVNVFPLCITGSAKTPVYCFTAVSPTGRDCCLSASLKYRAKNSRYEIQSREELDTIFRTFRR